MSFSKYLEKLPVEKLLWRADHATEEDVLRALASGVKTLEDFSCLLSSSASGMLENLAERAHALTTARFGRTIQLYAPLYVSNECANACAYCGFNSQNDISRKTLSIEEVLIEAQCLHRQGFRHILLVSGEHPGKVSLDYLERAAARLRPMFSSLSIEVGPLEEEGYRRLTAAGVDGLVVYQETYDRSCYSRHHAGGKKQDYLWRLQSAERGARSGMRRLGVGILLGLGDWKKDVICLAAHARYLFKHHWESGISVSLPRLRPAAGGFVPAFPVPDRTFAQLICALRLVLPAAGIALSTRENPRLRDGLIRLGVTHMSAGSRTEPGGYSKPLESEEQFGVEDRRSAAEVASAVERSGYEPVWKDWEGILHGGQ